MTIGNDVPNISYGVQGPDYKPIIQSNREAALIVEATLKAGYGVLKTGTALALNTSAGTKGKLIPYDVACDVAADPAGRAYLMADSGTNTYIYVGIEDSYKFAVGDDIVIVDSDGEGTADNGGAITAIDRTTDSYRAKITFTDAVADSKTLAKKAYAVTEGAWACVGILDKSVDTGKGSTAKGALCSVVVSNAVVYTGMLTNYDANAITDLGSKTWGTRYTILK